MERDRLRRAAVAARYPFTDSIRHFSSANIEHALFFMPAERSLGLPFQAQKGPDGLFRYDQLTQSKMGHIVDRHNQPHDNIFLPFVSQLVLDEVEKR